MKSQNTNLGGPDSGRSFTSVFTAILLLLTLSQSHAGGQSSRPHPAGGHQQATGVSQMAAGQSELTESTGSGQEQSGKSSPPTITRQPDDEIVTTGSAATFAVTATGSAPLSYQWQKNGVDIPGAVAASCDAPSSSLGDNGAIFAVTITNSSGSVRSRDSVLTVGSLEQYGTASTGVALRWKAYAPPDGDRHPAVIVLHAGGFKSGNAGPDFVSQDLVVAGFFALSTEYRLAPPHQEMNAPSHPPPSQNTVVPVDDGQYPEQTDDVAMAIRAARGDPRCNGTVYGLGGSAGASHVLYTLARGTPGDDQFDLGVSLSTPCTYDDVPWLQTACIPGEACPAPVFENYLGLPAGSVLLHLPELAAASPTTYVTSALPPFFFLYSDHDSSYLETFSRTDLIYALQSAGLTESH